MQDRIHVNTPWITPEARQRVLATLDAGQVSAVGPVVGEFEAAFAAAHGVAYGVATNSGTSALHLALRALGIGPGDEVIVPDFTMIASANAVLYCGAHPVFVDVDAATYTLDPARLAERIGPRTRAILAVHVYGHPAAMDEILAVARRHGIPVLEDAAEAHGSRYRGRLCGSLGALAAFSFYGNKLITTGEGGMVITDDPALAARVRALGDMAHHPAERFCHAELGYSYRMGSLPAALGLGQLDRFDELLARKQRMAAHYRRRLGGLTGLRLPITRPWAENSYWMFAVLLTADARCDRDSFRQALAARGIETRPFFRSCSEQPMFSGQPAAQAVVPVSRDIARRGCYLPSGLALRECEIDRVCDAVLALLG